jgi:hypothetical protein
VALEELELSAVDTPVPGGDVVASAA